MSIIVENVPKAGVHVYLFCFYGRENEPLGPVKIGITSNVASRLAGVQTGQHRKLHALAVFGTPNREIARRLESSFHEQLGSKRMEGEWFEMDPIRALETLCEMLRYYFQKMPECIDVVGIPFYEREIKVMQAWRSHYAENSNVTRIQDCHRA